MSRIVTPRPLRRKREPSPPPPVGNVVRQVRGVRVKAPPEPPRDYAAGDAADALFRRLAGRDDGNEC